MNTAWAAMQSKYRIRVCPFSGTDQMTLGICKHSGLGSTMSAVGKPETVAWSVQNSIHIGGSGFDVRVVLNHHIGSLLVVIQNWTRPR